MPTVTQLGTAKSWFVFVRRFICCSAIRMVRADDKLEPLSQKFKSSLAALKRFELEIQWQDKICKLTSRT